MFLSVGECGLEGYISRSIGHAWLCNYQSLENLTCRAFGFLTKRPEVQYIDRGCHLESKQKTKGGEAGKGGEVGKGKGASPPSPPLSSLSPSAGPLRLRFWLALILCQFQHPRWRESIYQAENSIIVGAAEYACSADYWEQCLYKQPTFSVIIISTQFVPVKGRVQFSKILCLSPWKE